jgi:hypothetical protein
MKLEFSGVTDQLITPQSVFFLYGNYKSTFDLFCNFMTEKMRKIFIDKEIEMHFLSVADGLKVIGEQCDLFSDKIDCFCLRHVEDNHLEKLQAILHRENTLFILECGDYVKSKKITDFWQKDKSIWAIASFKNDITYRSLCRMFFPSASGEVQRLLVAAMGGQEDALSSFFTKVSLLLEENVSDEQKGNNSKDTIKNVDISTDLQSILKRSFLQELGVIPLVRYLANVAIREKFQHKRQANLRFNLQKKDLFQTLLETEIKQKLTGNVRKSHLYQALI